MKTSELITLLAAKIAESGEDLQVLTYDSYHLTMCTPEFARVRTLKNLDGSPSEKKVLVLSPKLPNEGDW